MKRLFLPLLAAAVAVWGYVAVTVVGALRDRPHQEQAREQGARVDVEALLAGPAPPDSSVPDPFRSALYREKPRPKVVRAAPKKVLKVVEPPRAILSGVLWGDDPVAILKRDGKSELVKRGAEVWDFKVVKIERHQVTVRKEGREFTLGY